MKTNTFLLSFVGAIILFASCKPTEPELKEITPETCVASLMKYFPYTLDDEFIFVNDDLNHRIEAKAFDAWKDGIYPKTFIDDKMGTDLNSEWNCSIHASMFNKQINPDSIPWTHYWVERISAYVYNIPSKSDTPIEMIWRMDLRLSMRKPQEYFTAYWDVWCKPSELASLLTDTITLPIQAFESPDMDTTIVDGACVHIVRNEGIIDFTLDGKTFWNRVTK